MSHLFRLYLAGVFAAFLMACQPPASLSEAQSVRKVAQLSRTGQVEQLSPVARHGQLRVQDGRIVGESGAPASLAGPSFFWSNTDWRMARFYNPQAVQFFAEDWQAGIVRAAIAAQHEGSYLDEPEANFARAEAIIAGAVASDIYVIVDWHSHEAERHIEQAEAFFGRIAAQYGHLPNLIYEIYNEPLSETDWSNTIKPYAERIISSIRRIDPDNLIIVGTQSWSQDVDKAARDPIRGYDNIGYALHFYAGTHGARYRRKAERAIALGLPIMVTEWGSVDHTGDGAEDRAGVEAWMAFVAEHKLTQLIWAVSDKTEGAAMLREGAPSGGGWGDEDLTEAGQLARTIIRNWPAD